MSATANFVQTAALKQQLLGNIAKKTDNRQGKETVSGLDAEEVLGSVARRFWLLLKKQVWFLLLFWKWVEDL